MPFHHKKKQIEKDDWQDTDFSSYKNTSWKRKTTTPKEKTRKVCGNRL